MQSSGLCLLHLILADFVAAVLFATSRGWIAVHTVPCVKRQKCDAKSAPFFISLRDQRLTFEDNPDKKVACIPTFTHNDTTNA
jgi:hypothetical protein